MNSKLYSIFLLLLFPAINRVYGQELLISSESTIKDISINHDGRLYLLYPGKLCDFEGKQIVNECLPLENDVSFVVPVKDGHYAIFHENVMVTILHNKRLRTDTFPDIVTAVLLHNDVIYAGTAGSGLFQYHLNTREYQAAGLETEFVNDLAVSGNTLYVALDNGIAGYDINSGNVEHRSLPAIINHLSRATDHSIWAINQQGRFFLFNEKLDILKEINHEDLNIRKVSGSVNTTFFTTATGCYSLSTDHHIELLLEGSFQSLLALPNNLLLARENELVSYDLTVQITETEHEVFSVFAENDSILWTGSVNYIEKFIKGRHVKRIGIPTTLDNVFVSALVTTRSGIFVGTMGDGLFVLNRDGTLRKHILDDNENNRNNIIQLKYQNGILWIAYLNGVTAFNPESLTSIKEYDKILGNNYLYCIEPISKNEFYIGTSSNGVLHVKDGNATAYLGNYPVYSLCNTELGLMAGTKENGTYLMEGTSFRSLYEHLAPRSIIGIDKDVMFCLKNQCYLYANGALIPVSTGNLKNNQLNAITADHHAVYAGFANGILRVNKDRLLQLDGIALHLNQPLLFNELIEEGKSHFEYLENSFSFSFHPKNYYKVSNIIYRYRLLGLDSVWQSTQQNTVSFYNLRPGKYTFEVAGAFTEESVSVDNQQYTFEIDKPFWEKTWFIALVVILIIFAIILLIRRREERLLRKSREVEEKMKFELQQLKNQVDPHFLFNSFNSLIAQIEENPALAVESTQLLSDLYRNILKYEKLDFIGLEEELQLARQYFHMHRIRFEDLVTLVIEVSDSQAWKLIPLSCQFLIENAIKHNIINKDNKLTIRIKRENDYLVVENTFNPKQKNPQASTGLGLENLKARYRHLTNRPVMVETTGKLFIVKLPIQRHESNHH